METIILQANAKINLTMDVLRRRADGYHDVDLLMQSVTLHDTLKIEKSDTLSLTIDGGLAVSDNNLILRAARMLAQQAGIEPKAAIHLIKRIPVAAGLGGGSADAAAAFVGLNRMWGLNLSTDELCALGAKLGADVPFCIVGGCCRAEGIGTELTAVESRLPLHVLIVKPCEGLMTKEIYGGLHLTAETVHPDTAAAIRVMESGSMEQLIPQLGNVLEPVAAARQPEITEVIGKLNAFGARYARMSGSGSAVFGLFDTDEQVRTVCDVLAREYAECYSAQSAEKGVEE